MNNIHFKYEICQREEENDFHHIFFEFGDKES
jgi:hypothetical protein